MLCYHQVEVVKRNFDVEAELCRSVFCSGNVYGEYDTIPLVVVSKLHCNYSIVSARLTNYSDRGRSYQFGRIVD